MYGDSIHYRIRKVTPGGIISTVAGNGMANFSGDGGLATSASVPVVVSSAGQNSQAGVNISVTGSQ